MKVFWVTKRLAFGSAITTGGHVEQLETLGITHVVNLRHSKHRKGVRQFKSLWLPFPDDKEPRPKWFYRHALRFYVKAMRQPDSKLFVMCHHGICRSASLTYFFMRVDGLSIAKAKSTVLKARPQARIVPAYWRSGEDFRSLYMFRQISKGKQTQA